MIDRIVFIKIKTSGLWKTIEREIEDNWEKTLAEDTSDRRPLSKIYKKQPTSLKLNGKETNYILW